MIRKLPTISRKMVIVEIKLAQRIHEEYAARARISSNRNWHLRWVEVYRNTVYYLEKKGL